MAQIIERMMELPNRTNRSPRRQPPHLNCYAHTSGTKWEPLDDHLRAVAQRAREFADVFGAGDYGWLAGAFHDLGKVKPAFQAKLRGERNDEPHSAEGARAICDKYPALGRLIAPAIMGHHTGLANGMDPASGKPATPYEDRMRTAREIPPRLEIEREIKPPRVQPETPFEVQFFMRMLFSCLVDADFLETERFLRDAEPERIGEPERGWQGSLEGLDRRLGERLGAFGRPSDDVGQLRADVLAAAQDAANEAPGLFTLTVPTGGGKTLSSLSFALNHAIRHGMRRIVYVIPFTSIVEQTAEVFRDILGSDAVLEHHSAFDRENFDPDDREDADGAEKLRLAAQNWDRPVVVTTAVQFFESLFANRTSKCRKLHNLAGAVIILDEAQTLPLNVLRPCLAALSTLSRGYNSSVVLCTATQPAVRREDGFAAPEALSADTVREIAPDPVNLYSRLKRTMVKHCGLVNDDDLAERLLAEDQVLCIVNNRRHARNLFARVGQDKDAWHLTTTMCANHRRETLHAIREELRSGRHVRVIATSLVEAGVDMDFPCVWRAVSGIDSIAQAAGRCNREGKLGPEGGRVFVFRPVEDEDHFPPPELKQFAEIAGKVLERHDDPLSLDAVREYFRMLLWRRGRDALDCLEVGKAKWSGVLNAIEKSSGNGTQYAFADIAHAFRLIDDRTLPVIIPNGCHGAPDGIMRELLKTRFPGSVARRLQPYLVQVPIPVRAELITRGAAEVVRADEFGDQFVVLLNTELYDKYTGLNWDEPELLGVVPLVL